jgi:hypothetical protein
MIARLASGVFDNLVSRRRRGCFDAASRGEMRLQSLCVALLAMVAGAACSSKEKDPVKVTRSTSTAAPSSSAAPVDTGFKERIDVDGVADEFPYAEGWACASPVSVAIVLGPGAKKCTCDATAPGRVLAHVPVGPGGKVVAGGPTHSPFWMNVDLTSGRQFFGGDAMITLDADTPLEKGKSVRGTMTESHTESTTDGRTVTTSGRGHFSAAICEDRKDALYALTKLTEPLKALTATVAKQKLSIVTVLAGIDDRAPDKLVKLRFFPADRPCDALTKEDGTYVEIPLRWEHPEASASRHAVLVDYDTAASGPTRAGKSHEVQAVGWLSLTAVELKEGGKVSGVVFSRGQNDLPDDDGISGEFVAKVCSLKH